MTRLFEEMLLVETQKAAHKEVEYSISIINKIYNEWKKIGRRVNAVDLITTSANKIAALNPEVVDQLHAPAKEKLCVILMRCMDIPPWKPVSSKEKIYRKLFPLISKLEKSSPNTGTGANLREVIMTRLSAAIFHQDAEADGFAAYEPTISQKYLKYLHGDKLPKRTLRMTALSLPGDFESLINLLTINHEKAKSKPDGKVSKKP
jgi:hypothetical protein